MKTLGLVGLLIMVFSLFAQVVFAQDSKLSADTGTASNGTESCGQGLGGTPVGSFISLPISADEASRLDIETLYLSGGIDEVNQTSIYLVDDDVADRRLIVKLRPSDTLRSIQWMGSTPIIYSDYDPEFVDKESAIYIRFRSTPRTPINDPGTRFDIGRCQEGFWAANSYSGRPSQKP